MYGLLNDLERAFLAGNRRSPAHPWSTDPALGGWPRITARETDAALTFTLELPGFRESDVTVTLDHGRLTVAGKRKEAAPGDRRPLRLERGDFSFSQSFAIGVPVDVEHTTALFKNGVLTIHAPRREPIARQIPVATA